MILILSMLMCQSTADYFPLGDGMKWTYETDGKEEVKSVAKADAGWTVKSIGPWGIFREAVTVTRELVVVSLAGAKVDVPWLKSVKKGETWKARATLGDVACDFAFEVLGEEDVGVPAGKHRAVRVKLTFSDGEGTSGEWALWYAKGVGEVKSVFAVKGKPPLERRLKRFEK